MTQQVLIIPNLLFYCYPEKCWHCAFMHECKDSTAPKGVRGTRADFIIYDEVLDEW